MQTNPVATPESGLSVVPEPNPLEILQTENLQLKETINGLTDQCQVHQATIMALEKDKAQILERLQAHEENNYAMVMANLENGDVIHNASEAIVKLAELVEERQEPGKLSITITMEPFREGAQTAVAEIKMTEPKRDKKPSIFFCADGKLTRQSHRQDNLGF